MSEIRYDLLADNYVVIAPERLHRPDYMAWDKDDASPSTCPFCEGNEAMTPGEVYALREGEANAKGWKTRVVPNLYKAVQIEAPHRSFGAGLHSGWEGLGAHEILIDTPRHVLRIEALEAEEIFRWFKTIRHRIDDLRQDQRLVYMSVFKNHGPFAGATQPHPHTQLIALPVVPKSVVRRLERCHEHYRKAGRNIIEDIVMQELKDTTRLVAQRGGFVAFCPYASAYPFEVMIAATKPFGSLMNIPDDDLRALSMLLKEVYGRMARQLGGFDFNLTLSVPPLQRSFDTDPFFTRLDQVCRFHLKIMPRIYRHGGFELGSEMMINPVEPERAARLLRESAE